MFKKLRIVILLVILFGVALDAARNHFAFTDWDRPYWVTLYPINADGSAASSDFIAKLTTDQFSAITSFLNHEARRHGQTFNQSVHLRIGPQLHQLPPERTASGGFLSTLWWSLKLRYWSHQAVDDKATDIKIYVLFYDPVATPQLEHSMGIAKLSLAIAKVFASRTMQPTNNVIITHELLHVFGATDKYDPVSNLPLYPLGFAEPGLQPLYPQQLAEIMGGRIPLSQSKAVTPRSLANAIIGPTTAREINWTDK